MLTSNPEFKGQQKHKTKSSIRRRPSVPSELPLVASLSPPACDYLGERMASFFGITSAKYQYAIDEYYRMKKEVRPAVALRSFFTSFSRLAKKKKTHRAVSLSRRGVQREEEKEENRLSEEAERTCERSSTLEDEDEDVAVGGTPRAAAPRPDASYRVESESLPPPCVITVPAIVTAT